MKIEIRYHDLDKAIWSKISEDTFLEKNHPKPCGQVGRIGLSNIYQQYHDYLQKWEKAPDKKRIQLFEKLSAEALSAAPLLACNILIEEDGSLCGKITLEADSFILPPSEDRQLNHIFSDLFIWASDVFFSATASGLCRMEFLYSLHKEIPAEP